MLTSLQDSPVLFSTSSSFETRKTAHNLASSSSSEGDNDDLDALAVARFLRSTPGLSRAVVGDLLGDAAPRVATTVLGEFARSFDWRGVAFEKALRQFLDAFRLPGEAQKIYRVLDAWSVAFFEANKEQEEEDRKEEATAAAAAAKTTDGRQQEETPTAPVSSSSLPPSPFPFASADAVHVLAFSAVMLNTDAHNARVRLKMTREQFVLNNRGINGGGDLPGVFLGGLYDSIVERPIRGPREEEGAEAGSCSGGDCCSSGSRIGLVPGGGGSGSFGGGGGGPLTRVASASWLGRAAGGANGGSSSRNGGAGSGRRAASASGDGGASGGGEVKRLLQQGQQWRRRGRLFACFSRSGNTTK